MTLHTPLQFDLRRKHERDEITPEERAAIDAAIAAGKLKRFPPGVSGMADAVWSPSSKRVVIAKLPEKAHGTLRRRAAARARRDRVLEMHKAGRASREIEDALGVSRETVRTDILFLRERGLVE